MVIKKTKKKIKRKTNNKKSKKIRIIQGGGGGVDYRKKDYEKEINSIINQRGNVDKNDKINIVSDIIKNETKENVVNKMIYNTIYDTVKELVILDKTKVYIVDEVRKIVTKENESSVLNEKIDINLLVALFIASLFYEDAINFNLSLSDLETNEYYIQI